MRPTVLLLLIAAASGCVTSAPASVIAPAPRVEAVVEPPAPPLVRVVEVAEVVEIAPVEPPPVPERRIDRRSVYEQAGVTEWTLANGLTVVYLHDPDADLYRVRVQAPAGWAALPASMRAPFRTREVAAWGELLAWVEPTRRVAVARAETLAELLAPIPRLFSGAPDTPAAGAVASAFDRPGAFVVVMSGPAEREWVEPVIATQLATFPGRDAGFGPRLETPDPIATDGLVATVRAEWDDLPAVAIASRVLAERGGRGDAARLDLDPASRTALLLVEPLLTQAELLQLATEDAIRAARGATARSAATPEGRLLALAMLYEVPGDVRPARQPLDALALPDRVERTPPARVLDLFRRLADAAVVSAPVPQPE